MRFIFQLLLGMIIFNGMLIAFTPYFKTQQAGSTYSPINISDTGTPLGQNLSKYQSLNIEGLLFSFFGYFIASFFITLFVARLVSGGNLPTAQLLGACLVVTIFTSLWGTLSTPLLGIAGSFPSIAPFYTIFTIILGVVVTISVVEIFTGKGSEDG